MTHRMPDLVIEEIHRTRENISDCFGGSIAAIADDAARRQAGSNRLIWKSNRANKSLQPQPNSPNRNAET